jgi:hypothetical protein
MLRMINAQQSTPIPLNPSYLRAELARARVRAYCVAARLRMHPTTLSLILNGRRSLDSAVASRILAAIQREARNQVIDDERKEAAMGK